MKNMLIAFILNLCFSIFEFIGGMMTNSVAIMSDAIHDMGDALSIGLSCWLEKKSKNKADGQYTYGYRRYSVLGAVITSGILIIGSLFVISHAIFRIINPQPINYDGMLVFAIVGVIVNFIAAFVTKDGDSLNQKAVNLHMLEDVLGWVVVLIGSIVIKFTEFNIIDSVMSIIISLYILKNAVGTLKESLDVFLEKSPHSIDVHELTHHLKEIDGVIDIHHLHVWTLDGIYNCATLHVVAKEYNPEIKRLIKEELREHEIHHITVEFEDNNEKCEDDGCNMHVCTHGHHHHHHGHHHHH